jgi:lysophospholipase L1-like esterase
MKTFSYLALGDSYTIGESLPPGDSFPAQLVGQINNGFGLSCHKLKIVAKTGWTTNELQQGIQRAKPSGDFDLVSLLIGVNNQYRSYPQEQYVKEFGQLLNQAIGFAGGKKERVVVVSIPDYGCTPFGEEMAEKIFRDLTWYNTEAQRQCQKDGIHFVDIFPISRKAASEPDLIAEDRLHPSAKMYALWAMEILPVAGRILDIEKFQE